MICWPTSSGKTCTGRVDRGRYIVRCYHSPFLILHFRQKDLIRYLDKLIGMLLSAFEGNTPLETRLLDTERKAEKATKRFYEVRTCVTMSAT